MKKGLKITLIVLIILILLSVLGVFIINKFFINIDISNSKKTIEVIYNDKEFKLPKAKCNLLWMDITKSSLKVTKKLKLDKLGNQEVEFTCKKLFFKTTKSISYKVVDKESPVLKLKGQKELTITLNSKYEDQGAEASDNVDGNLTEKIEKTGEVDTSKEGKYEITYTVKDSSGNEATDKRTVTVKKVVVAKSSSNLACGSAGVIYLTFDDGPNAYYTPVILDVLKKYNVKATFFVTSAGPDKLIKREFDEGHKVGLHSSTHDYAKIYKSSEAFWKDMNTVASRVERITGKKSDIIRFPGGSSNTISRKYKSGIMTQLAKEVEQKGYGYFDWNISSGDAGGTTNPNTEYKNVINALSKSRGNVILMHDIKKHTSEAIESIVKYGLNNGYKFDVIQKNDICHQKVLN